MKDAIIMVMKGVVGKFLEAQGYKVEGQNAVLVAAAVEGLASVVELLLDFAAEKKALARA